MRQRQTVEDSVKKFRDPFRRKMVTVLVVMAAATPAELVVIVVHSKKLISSWIVYIASIKNIKNYA
jgi:hypothetical protein